MTIADFESKWDELLASDELTVWEAEEEADMVAQEEGFAARSERWFHCFFAAYETLTATQEEDDMDDDHYTYGDGRTTSTVTAEEITPGTVVCIPQPANGLIGWMWVTVTAWRGQGNGYADLLARDAAGRGVHCGSYERDHKFEALV